MENSRINQSVLLKDGRKLAFSEYGDPHSKPVFHFHGSGGSRLEKPSDPSVLSDLRVRLISTDRPGHGLSDPRIGRRLLDWPDDICQIADQLGVERFSVMGWSAGGPYALACAYKLPERVNSAALISGLAPPDRPHPYEGLPFANRALMFSARRFHPLVFLARRMMLPMINDSSESAGEGLIRAFPEVDQKILGMPGNTEQFVADIQEGYRQGSHGPAEDDILVNSAWGFRLEEIRVRVDIWQGELDRNVPINQAEFMHARLPNSRLIVLSRQAHVYLLNSWREVLEKLIED
jgi:pimeloyl-ACP methyl ester carboxylesterase